MDLLFICNSVRESRQSETRGYQLPVEASLRRKTFGGMHWESREGRVVVLLLGLVVELVFLLVMSAIVAAALGASFGRVFLHAAVTVIAPFFAYFDGLLTFSYIALVIAYQILGGGNNDADFAGYATGFGVSSLVIVLARYFWPKTENPVYSKVKYGMPMNGMFTREGNTPIGTDGRRAYKA